MAHWSDVRRGRRRLRPALVAGTAVATVAVLLTACSSTNTAGTAAGTGTGSGASRTSPIPQAAFSDHTGITSSSVRIGNVSTLAFGLFKGAAIGTEAYADYVNAQGGVDGRKLVVDSRDDGYAGGPNKQQTQAAITQDLAMVGSFSLQDSYGGTVLAANPGVPNVGVSLSVPIGQLPNSFAPAPVAHGWLLGPLVYFQKKYPTAVTHVGALVADQPSAETQWAAEKQAMGSLHYKIAYDRTFDITTTSFDQYVIGMRNAGVKILFMEQMPANYAAAVVKALVRQNFHPIVVLGASTYSEALVGDAGGPSAIDGAYLAQNAALYLGEDAKAIPAAATFQHWVQHVSPGFSPDLFTLYGWLSGQLFAQALRAAGPDPSRGSVLQQLRKITSFNGGGIIGTADPAAKTPTNCYIIARIVDGKFQRVDDPPINSSSKGFRCDQPFFYAKG